MELLLECIMMKNFSDNSIKSIRIPEDSYSIGILLSSPINYTSIPLLEVLLNISSCNDLPDYIQLGALTNWFADRKKKLFESFSIFFKML